MGTRLGVRGVRTDQRIARAQPHCLIGAFEGLVVRAWKGERQSENSMTQCEVRVQRQCPTIRTRRLVVTIHSKEHRPVCEMSAGISLVEAECGPRFPT